MRAELRNNLSHNLGGTLRTGRSWGGDYDDARANVSLNRLDFCHAIAANRIRGIASDATEIMASEGSSWSLSNYGDGLAATAPATSPLTWSCAARRSTAHFWQASSSSVPGFSHSSGSGGSTAQLKLFHKDDSPLLWYESHIRPPANMALFTRPCEDAAHPARSMNPRAKTNLRI